MKVFQRMNIVKDELQVICLDEETSKEEVLFSIDMTDFYWEPGHLKDNVLIDGEPNEEFLENFCCDVPEAVEGRLSEEGVAVKGEVDFCDLFNDLLSQKFGI